jgi:myo-inositol 2-dehydrogenase/D-chiro-inositol 1-dehydrogenase
MASAGGEPIMTVSFALLGAGRIGKVHARAIAGNAKAKLVAVSDAMPVAAQAVSDQTGAAIRSIADIAADKSVDAVVICTPTDTHADLIEQFARAGKAIFCEKPIDLALPRVRACLSVVKATNAPLMLGFNRRFDPDFRAVKAVIEAGEIGAVEMVTISSRDPGPPPADYITRSGGIFRDMTIHDFDMARWLLGEEPDSVFASASVLTDPNIGRLGDFDSANVILRTASGKQATITNSRRAAYGYDQRIEVLGALGAVSADNTHLSNIQVATKAGFTRPPLLDFFMTRYERAYAAEIAAFIAALEGKTAMPVTGEDGMLALALAEAALRSVAEGRAVKVSEVLA